ncbi:dTDP-glucose 4,6-dehydratase [Melghirimyces profundicolus]|uniref:dTDP-glucose 4,6-dehydratase n=1 Tax=Melghirimyces profundicolus TaxID=1242148 RepID=A0A2T6B277_9BACL|nr:dTDP-glucose 4,6-dehydratase [Melghirimyces profundicolus]PTX50135.1 dTDP-glucose 4,6-dehydratase [Melghirimyces profundicolus]
MSYRILVTGGCGFIGSHYVRYLLNHHPDIEVINADALKYSANPLNLVDMEEDPRYIFAQVDLADERQVRSLFRREIHEVVHFAAESHVDRSIRETRHFILSNIVATHHLLEEARQAKHLERMVHVSTDEVYGSVPQGRTREEAPLSPGNPYSATKAGSDLLCMAYHNTYGLNVTITRCTNNYGPNQHPEKMIPRFILNALQDRPLPVYGSGLQQRDWIHVEDHCAAVDRIRRQGKPGEVYHIGSEHTVPNMEIARMILSIMDKPESLLQRVSDRPGHDFRYSLSTEKIRSQLSWSPRIPLEKGLADTVAWFRKQTRWLHTFDEGEPESGGYEGSYR